MKKAILTVCERHDVQNTARFWLVTATTYKEIDKAKFNELEKEGIKRFDAHTEGDRHYGAKIENVQAYLRRQF